MESQVLARLSARALPNSARSTKAMEHACTLANPPIHQLSLRLRSMSLQLCATTATGAARKLSAAVMMEEQREHGD